MEQIRKVLYDTFNLNADCASGEEIEERIRSGGQLRGTNMCIMILAMFIASIGLNMNSPAVIIGAMLISPLMGGIMNIAYGIAAYDMGRVRHAFLKLAFQVVFCVMVSTIYFWLSPIKAPSSELMNRTSPTIYDVLIAVFGGLAGIIGTTRKEKVTNVIPGVAIATALMPPLCTAGYGIARHSWQFFGGAMYLFFINCFFICLSSVIVLKLVHVSAKQEMEAKPLRRQKLYIAIFGIIMVLPSVYLAWQMIQTSAVNSQFNSFIASRFDFEETQVVSKSLDTKNNVIKVAVIGKRLDEETQQSLQDSLAGYSELKDMKIFLTQTEYTGGVNKEEVEALINSQLALDEDEIVDFETKNQELQAKLDLYAPAYIQCSVNASLTKQMSEELPLFYPQIRELECVGQGVLLEDKTLEITKYLLLLKVDRLLNVMEMEKVETWAGAIAGKEVEAAQKYLSGMADISGNDVSGNDISGNSVEMESASADHAT